MCGAAMVLPGARTGNWSTSRTTVLHRRRRGRAWGEEGKGLPSTSSACATKPLKTSGLYKFERKKLFFYVRIQIGKHISLQALENECHPPHTLCP